MAATNGKARGDRMRLIDLCIRKALTRSAARYAASLQQRLERYRAQQSALHSTYALDAVAPQGYSEHLRSDQIALHASHPGSHLILTSGTTSTPKEVWYTEQRLNAVQGEFLRQVLLLAGELPLESPSIYFLTALSPSRSLSSALLRAPKLSFGEHLALSQSIGFAPRSLSSCKDIPELWLHIAYILLTQPALLVAANPSTVLILLQHALSQWSEDRTTLRRLLPDVWSSFSRIRRRAYARNTALERSLSLTELDTVTARDLLPGLEGIACWTGGYVRPYITRLHSTIDTNDLRILPLLSLSSEEILGLHVPGITDGSCVPLGQHVAYEFIQEGDEARQIVKPWELQVGRHYSIVVSNRYGLKRYDTADLFLCTGRLGDAPLITFVGRAGLQHSFSGEKLTAEHLLEAYQRAYTRLALPTAETLCFPHPGRENEIPRYVFLATRHLEAPQEEQLAREIDTALHEINSEYRSKRESGRLAAPQLYTSEWGQVIAALEDRAAAKGGINRAQVKLMPLYPKLTWPEMRSNLAIR
jgi:hypothetical protein